MVEQIAKLGAYLGVPIPPSLLHELEGDSVLHSGIEDAVSNVDFFRRKRWESVLDFGLYRVMVYCLCRVLRPAFFLETGVLHGLTTCFSLAAVARNGYGQVVSIDLPSHFEDGPANKDGINDTLPPGKEPGWIIPDAYRPHWRLILGDSAQALPEFFAAQPRIDIFLHDSEHTYATMWREISSAWEHIIPGGVLIADNIDMNTSFFDFCNLHERSPRIFASMGTLPASDKIRFAVVKR